MTKGAVLLARIRIQAARLKKDELWRDIAYGPKRLVRCGCGGAVLDRPQLGDYTGLNACAHIIALYEGHVTEDKRETVVDRWPGLPIPWLVQLTRMGRDKFEWRWAVRKLASSAYA